VRDLAAEEIQAYLDSGEWRGKAGAYAIQGIASLLVQGIEGDHSNVVGLPLSLVGDLFREAGFDPVRRVWLR
jgi:septum formation protein